MKWYTLRRAQKIAIGVFAIVCLFGAVNKCKGETIQEEFNGKEFKPELSHGFTETSWTTGNKIWLGAYVAANIADVTTSQQAFDRGCTEGNPFMPESLAGMIATKVVISTLVYYSTEKWLVPAYGTKARNYVYGATSVVMSVVSISNNSCEN